MIRIKLDDLIPGMKIAGDVIDDNGRHLIKKQTVLTQKSIRILKAWGITEVDVFDGASNESGASSDTSPGEDLVKKIERALIQRFMYNDLSHEAVQELLKLCVKRKSEMIDTKEHCYQIKDIFTDPLDNIGKLNDKDALTFIKVEELIGKIETLPTLPNIYFELHKVITDPRSSAREIADIISKDMSLSARILKIANSAFYGFRKKIETISEAVVTLGIHEIGALSLGLTYVKYFKNIPNNIIDMNLFWEHSIACAIAARTIGSHAGVENIERLFVGGILHDIGRLLLFSYYPDEAGKVIRSSRTENGFVYDKEEEILGVHHSDIGGMLLEKWGLPESIRNMVAFHHAPESSASSKEPAIISLADVIINALCLGTSGEQFIPVLKPETWNAVGISKNVLAITIKQIDRQMIDVFRFFQDGQ